MSTPTQPLKVLMLCTGNICRSPTAHVVMDHLIGQRGLAGRLEVDSAGTQAYHEGEGADPRSVQHGTRRGLDFSAHRARRLRARDLEEFDWILAMDRTHLEAVERMSYPGQRARTALFLASLGNPRLEEVPDPYYGGASGFESVLDLCQAGCEGWISSWFPPSSKADK